MRDDDEIFEHPITDSIDLHTFRPEDLAPLLDDYLEECVRRGFGRVRIIHGKGSGAARRRVRGLLARHGLVLWHRDAEPHEGGWGATVVGLKRVP